MPKRLDYISWDRYFLGIAKLSAMRSKDPKTQVGAVIVSTNKKISGIGYNGFPRGIDDDHFSWESEGDWIDTKYPYVVHAEANAILNSTEKIEGSSLYVTLFPCNECAKLIIQAGIKEIVYISDKFSKVEQLAASKKMLAAAGISLRKINDFTLELK
ncbi:MAG: dCMP deaminase family protein [Acholeplasmatales bacterium]|jgi:dCMP deaminase|nr:dCMP deaminase family protein [Acholeplasmatales bacterium]